MMIISRRLFLFVIVNLRKSLAGNYGFSLLRIREAVSILDMMIVVMIWLPVLIRLPRRYHFIFHHIMIFIILLIKILYHFRRFNEFYELISYHNEFRSKRVSYQNEFCTKSDLVQKMNFVQNTELVLFLFSYENPFCTRSVFWTKFVFCTRSDLVQNSSWYETRFVRNSLRYEISLLAYMLRARISRSTEIPSSSLINLIVMPILVPAARISIIPRIPVSAPIVAAASSAVSESRLVSHLSRIVGDHAAQLDRAQFLSEFIWARALLKRRLLFSHFIGCFILREKEVLLHVKFFWFCSNWAS